ncbi:MAG: hypothetical protein OXE17_04705 [Chloroflexi bacterium]|nr:hypothetical protein [Chloroflexota bacterium]
MALWVLDPDLGETMAAKDWVQDGIVGEELHILGNLEAIANRDARLARKISRLDWFDGPITRSSAYQIGHLERISAYDLEALEALEALIQLPWAGQQFEREATLSSALRAFRYYVEDHPEKVAALLQTTWFYLGPEYAGQDHFSRAVGLLTHHRPEGRFLGSLTWITNVNKDYMVDDALDALTNIMEQDAILAENLSRTWWVIDGINPLESRALQEIERKAETDLTTARAMAESVYDGVNREDLRRLSEQ